MVEWKRPKWWFKRWLPSLCQFFGDQTIKVWELSTGKEMRILRGHTSYVPSIAISADGQQLFSASGDKTIKVWGA
jgi:WD40 repeat protein